MSTVSPHPGAVQTPEPDRLPPLGAAGADPAFPGVPDHEVLRRIGRGSYGEIRLARAVATGAWRAVKFVWRDDFDSERSFRREFEGMMAFEPISRSHAGFVDILQVGRDDGRGFFYYVMELADHRGTGRPLSDPAVYAPRTLRAALHDRGRLPPEECLALGLSLTEALGALHSHGLSHRDIKPDNIIFVGGVPKLADIGLVAAHGQRSFVGTEGYVPPEGPGGVSADLYSLGKVLYEVSMGKDRLDFPALASDLHEAAADPGRATLLRGLNAVLLRVCDPRVNRRYASAAEMHADLLALQAGRPPQRRRSRLAALGLALGASVAILAAVAGREIAHRAPVKVAPVARTDVNTPVPDLHAPRAVRIESEPTAAEIFDGFHPLGRTPLRLELPPGSHELTAHFPRWPDVRQRFEIPEAGSGQAVPPVVFRFAPANVRLESEPPGATVRLGEKEVGETPCSLGDEPPGPVVFTFVLPGFRRESVEATLKAGENAPVRAALAANHAPVPDQPWENSLGMKLVPLGGAVMIGVWETRVRDFAAFVDASGYDATSGMTTLRGGDTAVHGASWRQPGFPQTPTDPVVGVSWKDAYAFCDWLTQKEQENSTLDEGQFYRLPTDLEWSRAAGLPPETGATPEARSGKVRGIYPWGTQWPPPHGVGNYAGAELRAPGADWPAGWHTVPGGYADGFTRTAPAGSFTPNALGIYDLGGNAWEWCEDRYAPGAETCVLRGGAWGNVDAELLLSSRRIEAFPHSRSDLYGFRVVLETPAYGRVEITSEPPGASVFHDDTLLGRTPLTLNRVPCGDTAYAVKLDGYQPASLPAHVAANARLALRAALVTAGGPQAGQPWENGLHMRFAPVGETLLFSVWETRAGDFDAFCRETGRVVPTVDFEQTPTHPVVNVNRDDAEAFCAWLTAAELAAGRLRPGQLYRLPTDREWSRAAGMPEETGDTPEARDGRVRGLYPWGKEWPPPTWAGNLSAPESTGSRKEGGRAKRRLTPGGESYTQTAPVGSFAPNAFGLYDLAGNVWEWCSDPYKSSGALRHRGVLRGGSWADSGPGILQSSYRNAVPRGERDVIYGFRCVIDTAAAP